MIYSTLLTALALTLTPSLTSAIPLKRASGVTLRPANGDQCLVTSAGVGNGVGIVSTACSQAQFTDPTKAGYGLWDISPGDQQSLKLTGTNFCLDAGDNPGTDSRGAKVWTCYPGLAQQRWYYTDDLHIAITGGNTCLSEGRYGTTTEACGLTGGAIGTQQFASVAPGTTTTIKTTTAASTTAVSTTAATTSAQSTTSPVPPPPSSGGNRIYWNGDKTKCLTVDGGFASNGAGLVIVGCMPDGDTFTKFQLWDIQRGAGAIKLHGTDFCIDYGLAPGNGVGGKIWQCYDGAPQQNSYYTDDNHIAQTGGSVCLDVRAESGPGYNKPYGSLKSVQEYQCTGGNGNQVFTL